ncbi:MAG: sigma 54-interacting transcriptional regulator [Telluria sp.]
MKFVSATDSYALSAEGPAFDTFLNDERLDIFADLLPDGIVLIDQRGMVRAMNAAAESINEVLRAVVVGQPLSEFVKRSRLDCEAVLKAFADGARITQVVPDGHGRRYLFSTRSSRQRNGEIRCFLLVQRNLDVLTKLAASNGAAQHHFGQLTNGAERAPLTEQDTVVTGKATAELVERGLRAMRIGSRLLLLGESGVGKTALAKLLHQRASGPERPFIHVNCGSIPESLFESEMFGYERGSFTGASNRGKRGLIEGADGGTLFLDEVGEIPLPTQAKMLQVLEEGMVQRVGATAPIRLKLQIIAATNRDLNQLVKEGRFRRDLFYRLSVITLTLPPLRERRDMLASLLDKFLNAMNRRRPTPLRIDDACRLQLEQYDYPGNVRELQNVVEHLAVVCDEVASAADLPFAPCQGAVAAAPVDSVLAQIVEAAGSIAISEQSFALRDAVKRYEVRIIEEAIRRTGSKRKAAELLQVDIATVVRKSNSVLHD